MANKFTQHGKRVSVHRNNEVISGYISDWHPDGNAYLVMVGEDGDSYHDHTPWVCYESELTAR